MSSSRATMYWRSMVSRLEGKRAFATSSTTPKMKEYTRPTRRTLGDEAREMRRSFLKGENTPIRMVMGFVLLASLFAGHTAKQQLRHAPAVNISKKKRECMPEVDHPDVVIASADNFINKSWLRKIAHIQDRKPTVDDPVHPDPFTRPRNAETLKSVGVDPSSRH